MRTALPNASFLAFTGTPLIIGEEKTRHVFGEYISVYDFRQSVEDGGSINVEEFFRRLVAFTRELTVEEQRAISEELSEEELAIFDLLTKPEIKLSPKERRQVKAAARELLDVLKREKLVLDWRKRQKDRAQVRVTIEILLDQELPEVYTAEIFQTKTNAVYQHIYESYFGAGRNIYSLAV
jgi:type I restriction enzyme R subunit